VVLYRIARKYKARFVNEALRIYFQVESNQLSKKLPKAHTQTTIFYGDVLNWDIDWFRYAPFLFWRAAVVYAHFSFLIKNSWRAQWQGLTNGRARLLWVTGAIPGYLLAKRDLLRSRK